MELGRGLYIYFILVILFSIGIVGVVSLQRRRHYVEPFINEYGPKDGDVVVNVSLVGRTLGKELGKLAKEISKNISSLK